MPKRLAFWSSISLSCWLRSISMMSGTARIRKVVLAIHATLPVLQRSFLDTTVALEVARFAWMMMDDWDTLRLALDIRECSLSLPWVIRFFSWVTPFSNLSEEEFEEVYTSVTLSLSLSKFLNYESVIVICKFLLYKFLLIFVLFLELSVGQCWC